MASYVQDSAVLVDTVDALAYLAPQRHELSRCRHRSVTMLKLAEYPRSSYRCTPDHHAVDAITSESLLDLPAATYITVADQRYGQSGI